MSWKSILKPEGSTMAGIATVAVVASVYELSVGNISAAHVTDANHPALESSRKKAGLTCLALVAGLTLITRDANVGILGAVSIIAMELTYRHGIMSNETGKMQNPIGTEYSPAQNVVPFPYQGATG